MDQFLDSPGPVREGEALDADRLTSYLAAHLPGPGGPVVIEQFPQGYSNLTYLIHWNGNDYVLRRPPFGNPVQSAHDMGREFRVLSQLAPVYPPAPRPLLFCAEETVLGAPFYLMERRCGVILRRTPPPGLPLAPATLRRLGETFIENLALLHRLDYRAIGLADLGRPEGYVERQVSGWTQRYRNAETEEIAAMDALAAWLAAHRPAESGAALVHNDYKFDNLVLDPGDLTRIVAVLDWEMATVGDPLLDLGTTLGYWVTAGDPESLQPLIVGPTHLPGSLTRRELVERYARAAGRDLPEMLFYYLFGLFKIAVIAQQIYARYARGLTRDPRFARLNVLIAQMSQGALEALEAGRV
jgi:aminoglycoside phosphotransferase (APT) family kinase protein